jgi:multidrug resistance efflux pump
VSDEYNTIDGLLLLLSERKPNGCYYDQRYHAALTALVAERDGLRAELAAANAQLVAKTDELVAMSKMCAAVTLIMEEMQRDEARLDAERYRWLKSGGCYWVEIQSQPHGDYIFKGQAARSIGGSIDNAIDAMLAAMRMEGGGA